MESEFDGLKREDVAFYLKNKLHASFAAKKLLTHGEVILNTENEVLHNPKWTLAPYLIYSETYKEWMTLWSHVGRTVYPIAKLPNFLKHLGLNDDKYQKVLQEIDKLDRQATSGKRYGRTGLSNKGR